MIGKTGNMLNDTNSRLQTYRESLKGESNNILNYWTNHTLDTVHGGFLGKIANDNQPEEFADKGAVLNARILWAFSACYNLNSEVDLSPAARAYDYIVKHFIDEDFGGVYWTVDFEGHPKDTKKQVYALAFTVYALSEYFMATGSDVVKDHAVRLYHELILHSYDEKRGGYFEAFNREWQLQTDLRLSEKDANEKKTMNTHLHVLEAFTNLYRMWPDAGLKEKIRELLEDFRKHIVDPETYRMILFFDEDWNRKSDIISYGHDIEASWLLQEAAEVTGEEDVISEFKALAVKMAEAALSGLDADGSLWYENKPSEKHLIKEKHWWVQAEAMVGFFNAWQLSRDERFLDASVNNWNFVQGHILDKENGEWFWGVQENGSLMESEDKVGIWKCPYHNSRACIELIRRIGENI